MPLDNQTVANKPPTPEIPKPGEKEPVRELLDQMTRTEHRSGYEGSLTCQDHRDAQPTGQ